MFDLRNSHEIIIGWVPGGALGNMANPSPASRFQDLTDCWTFIVVGGIPIAVVVIVDTLVAHRAAPFLLVEVKARAAKSILALNGTGPLGLRSEWAGR